MIHLYLPEEPKMPERMSSTELLKRGGRLKLAVMGAIDATKNHPQYRFERFIEALHANGFQVEEIEVESVTIHESSSSLGHG